MRRDARLGRIGLTVLVALAVGAAAILLVGEQNFLFTRTNRYYVLFPTVAGLATGNPVQLNGVVVGKVDEIILPEDMGQDQLRVWVSIERRYATRVREDSVARIKTLGLLGDKYVDITSGSPQYAEVPAGEQIPAAPPTDVDRLIASGEDVLDNVVATASALSKILTRMEQGDGLLGELVTEREDGKSVADSVISTLESVDQVAKRVAAGEGTLGRLVTDDRLADDLADSVERVGSVLDSVEQGDGVLGKLIHDEQTRDRFDGILTDLETTLGELSTVASDLRESDGLLNRLLYDEQWGDDVAGEIGELVERLNRAAEKITEGEGTAAQLINDPSIYEALQDIIVGVNESKLLRWLIRNRQKKGIEVRYEEAVDEEAQTPNDPG